MAVTAIADQRLYQQRLTANPFVTAAEVVAWLGAVQAQDYQGAKWSLGLRMDHATDDAIERAFNDGSLLRTHIMRPTWHFVSPADIRWILELTALRTKARIAHMDRRLELDNALILRSNAIIVKALQGGRLLTRTELDAALAEAGIITDSLRLIHIVMHAELDALVCSGPRRGKQFTYALLDERAPQTRVRARDEALAELTRRYYVGHGPATVRDFAGWSGLTVADVKAGLEMAASHLAHDAIDHQTYWFSASMPTLEPSSTAFLMPTYDEFLVGFASFGKSLAGGREVAPGSGFSAPLVIGGQVMGSWKRTLKKRAVVVELTPFAPLTALESEAVSAAAERYGKFLSIPVTILTG